MNKTRIEWVKNPDNTQGYTLNPIKGKCPRACSYCYARRMYDRFKWNPEPRFDDSVLDNAQLWSVEHGDKTAGIFMCSTFEWLWNKDWATNIIIWIESLMERHRFYLLTKYPERLWAFSPFPKNVYVGVTVDEDWQLAKTLDSLRQIKASVKFISFEPFREYIDNCDFLQDGEVDQIIIGAQTPSKGLSPELWEHARELINYADKGGIPVFIKNNMGLPKYSDDGGMPFYKKHSTGTMELRQEFPHTS